MSYTATAYVELKASRRRYGSPDPRTGLMPIEEVKAVYLRQGQPGTLKRDEIAIKVSIQVPQNLFDPISPEALVVLPSGLAIRGPVEVVAVDAGEDAP